MAIMGHSGILCKQICRLLLWIVFPNLLKGTDNIGQLWTPMVTDEILQIRGSDPHRPPAAVFAAELDHPEDFLLYHSTHSLLGNVQDFRRFRNRV